MRDRHLLHHSLERVRTFAVAIVGIAMANAAFAGFIQTNLVSSVSGFATFTDMHLRNPWGIAASATSPFWVGDNATGLSTLYNSLGQPFPIASPLVVTIPPPPGSPQGTQGVPTGVAFNTAGAAGAFNGDTFLFATENGTIAGWRGALGTAAETLFTTDGADYTGIAVTGTTAAASLFAANFAAGSIDKFGALVPGTFTDPTLPSGYSPFNIQNLGGTMYVTYALRDPATGDEIDGLGLGFVDAFDTSGNFLRRVAGDGPLDAPWGLALAPAGFGAFGGALLVGNLGNGFINAFNPVTGAFLDALRDTSGNPIQNDGLWGLQFGNGGNGGTVGTLYFAAGIRDEAEGLFGSIRPEAVTVPEPVTLALVGLGIVGIGFSRRKQ